MDCGSGQSLPLKRIESVKHLRLLSDWTPKDEVYTTSRVVSFLILVNFTLQSETARNAPPVLVNVLHCKIPRHCRIQKNNNKKQDTVAASFTAGARRVFFGASCVVRCGPAAGIERKIIN